MKKTLKSQLLELSKAHVNWKNKAKVFCYGTAVLLMVAPTLAGSVSIVRAEDNSPKATKSGDRTGTLALNVSHSALDEAVSDAKAAGLTVNKESTQDKGNAQGNTATTTLQKSISDDYASQTSTIQKQTADYKTALAAYNKAYAAYQAKLAEIQAEIDNGTAGSPAVAQGQGLKFLKGKNPNATVSSVSFSGSGDGALVKANTLDDGLTGLSDLVSSDVVGQPDFYDLGGTTSLFGLFLDPNQSVTITYKDLKNFALNGKSVIQMKVTYTNVTNARMGMMVSRDPGNQFQYGVETNGRIFVNQPKALQEKLQFYDDSNTLLAFQTVDGASAQFMAGSLNYSKSKTPDGDFPPTSDGYNQHEAVSFNHDLVSGKKYPSSGVSKVSGRPTSGANASGDSWGVNPPNTNETWAATGFNDYKTNGSDYEASVWDVGTDNSWYGGVNLIPKEGETSITVTWSTTDANMWADLNGQLPTMPDGSTVPEPPTKPTVPTVSYHYDKATFQTDNNKSVTQTDGRDINGDLINKQATVKFPLKNDPLPAGHETMESYVMDDPLPEGFDLDLEASKKFSPDYDITYDEKTNTATLTATKATLAAMNKDLDKAYQVPTAYLEGQVTKDDASFTNDFETIINDYSVTSNEVEVHTPDPQPEKTNENASGTTINGQGIDVNATNYYKLLWDLSVYKDVVASKDDVAKGFFLVDDAPELVDVDLKNASFIDSTGKAVAGIKATLYASVDKAPQEVQDRLKASKITPEGQFVFYDVSDSQSFYTNYVQKGIDININAPMTFKEGATGNYENTVYQSDFGNGYESNTVKNNIVPPKVTKQVSVDDGKTWQESKGLADNDSLYDYKLNYSFTANGDYTKITLIDGLESVQWLDLSKVKVTDKDGKAIAGSLKVLNSSGKDVTKDFNEHVFQKDGKKEVLQIVFTPDKISDITALASTDDPDRMVALTMYYDDVTLKGATGAELANYLNKDGKIIVPNIGQLDTTSQTVTGGNTKDEVTKSNETKVNPPQLAPMISKYIYDTGVGSSVDLYDKGVKLPSYLSENAQFTSLNLHKSKQVKPGDTVQYMIVAQSGNTSLMKNIVDTLPKELSFASDLNGKVFVLSNDGKTIEEVTKAWKIGTSGQTLTATPNDPTNYLFAGLSTNSRVIVTLDAKVNEDVKTGTYPNVATLTNQDGKTKTDKANVSTTVKAEAPAAKSETPTSPAQQAVEEVANVYLPKTGDAKSIFTALGAWLITAATVLGVVTIIDRKTHVFSKFWKKTKGLLGK